MTGRRGGVALLLLVLAACDAGAPPVWDGTVEVHGALRAMMHEGQTGAQVTLDRLLPHPHLYGVGALADLAGEITIVGGRAYLSRPVGNGDARTEVLESTPAGASLLVSARVGRWQDFIIEEPIPFDGLDEAIARLADAAGVADRKRLPFLIEGEVEDLRWHVIDGRRLAGGGDSHEDHLAAAVQIARPRTYATIVGFYSESDQGVFTHMGSRTHLHCVVGDPLSSGHVDHVIIPAGTTIRFPATGR